MDILFSSLAAGILFGMALSLVALGLTIIFGVMDIINFAHGEFLMIGMYTGLLTAQAAGHRSAVDPSGGRCRRFSARHRSAISGSSNFCCADR